MSKRRFSFCIVPGWAENRWKTHDLLIGLVDKGGLPTADTRSADVVIAHSAGCHLLPKNMKARLVVMIGPIYGERRLSIRSLQEYVADTAQYYRRGLLYAWVMKNVYFLFLGLSRPRRIMKIYRRIQRPFLNVDLRKYKMVVVRNKRDYFCSPQIKDELKSWPNIKFVQMAGVHDDCWINPQPYINLILKEL